MKNSSEVSNNKKSIRVAIVTNIPTPYRRPVYEILANTPDISLKVVYCSEREPDREWDFDSTSYEAEYLNERFYTVGDKFIHVNPEVFGALRRFKPDVVIGTGFNPTHLIAAVYSATFGCAFVPMTDGTYTSEQNLSFVHRVLRRFIYSRAKAFIAASDGGFDLYRSYNVIENKIFKSHLCANNEAYRSSPEPAKIFDLIFSGRFGELKNPLFAVEVAKSTALKLGRKVSLAFLGAGPMEKDVRVLATQYQQFIDVQFLGFARQAELPDQYKKAKLLLFPTLADVWGVVANEALAAGLPVIISQLSGCAAELVRHEQNGFVLSLDVEIWASAVVLLLNDTQLYKKMSNAGKSFVAHYNYQNAARGIADASRFAIGEVFDRHPDNMRAAQ
jgi:glycosyltransferase involved in cell wall biosynthesis